MPASKKAASKPTPVDAITHADKRTNLPTADAQEFVVPEIDQPTPVRYPRDPTLDPQLVWKGKDALDGEDLVADAPAIYIQEKIDPRVIIENLRRTRARSEDEPELKLFDTFDGLPALDLVEFYQHQANWSNRMILGDSLNVMASLAEREALRGKVQMIYIDPPYGIKFGSNWQVSARRRDVKDGKLEDASREVEQIKAFRDTWELGIHSYLTYLRDRFTVARDLLTESGSIFVQIGDENVHLVRSLLDEVFGSANFVSQIIFRKKLMPLGSVTLERMHDHLLWFAADKERLKYRQLFLPSQPDPKARWTGVQLEDGTRRPLTKAERVSPAARPPSAKVYSTVSQWAPSYSASNRYDFTFRGRVYSPPPGQCWVTSQEKMAALATVDRLEVEAGSPRYVMFHEDFPFHKLTNPWTDTAPAQDQRYVVETNTAVIERCLHMTTDPGDLVLDPTCGSGTTAYVAEQWGRRWITIDTSRVALALARQRVMGAQFPFYLLSDSEDGRTKEGELSTHSLPFATVTNDIRHGFVCQRVQHITLKSIANNPDIVEGMSREEIDTVIRRHSDFELLYDKPYEDSKKVRVSGLFTVESLSPHRALAFAGSAVDGGGSPNVESIVAPALSAQGSFEETIVANLRAAGVQNGRRHERMTFDTIEAYAATHIQAVGVREDAPEGTPRRVGITIGPEYGTVGPGFIKDAAREAIRAGDLELLCVLAFAFDPTVLGDSEEYVTSADGFANVAAERRLGRVPVQLVRMNADLVMGEELRRRVPGTCSWCSGSQTSRSKRMTAACGSC